MGRSAAKSLVSVGLLVGLAAFAAVPGCGGGKSGGPAASTPTVSGDVASLSLFVVSERSSDPFVQNAVTAVTQTLSKAGYKVVEDEKAADVFARLAVSKVEEPSMIPIMVNGKQLTNNKVTINLEIVDRDSKAIESTKGDYTSSDGAADEDAVAGIVGKLTESQKLAGYATSSKKEREERKAREEKERKAMEAEQRERVEREEKAKKEREARVANEAQIRDLEKLRKEMDDILKKGESELPEDKLRAFKEGGEKLRATMSNTARAYSYMHTSYMLENTWWKPDVEGAKALAGALESELVSNGASDGKKLAVTVNAKTGNCYTVLMKWKTTTGQEEIKDLKWTAKGSNTPLQRYWLPTREGGMRVVGTCVTKDTPVTLSADLIFAGTKNGVRYAVVNSPKSKFPMYLATYLATGAHDRCDTESWYSMWADPIPGSIAYVGKEPFLIADATRPGDDNALLASVLTHTQGKRKQDLISTPPKGIKFATQFSAPGCSAEKAEGVDSIKLAKCHEQITAKYKGQWDAAERARDSAITILARRVAEQRLGQLHEAETNDRERTCKPIEQGIAKKWETTYNKIVDLYTENPYKSPIDRASELAAQADYNN